MTIVFRNVYGRTCYVTRSDTMTLTEEGSTQKPYTDTLTSLASKNQPNGWFFEQIRLSTLIKLLA